MSEPFDADGNLNDGLPGGPRTGQQVFHELQRLARAEGRASGKPVAAQEYLTRHTLESFLDRLNMTGHAKDFESRILRHCEICSVQGRLRPRR